MQSSNYPCGIGFGGEDCQNFRIWLDYDLTAKSQSTDFDKTYENGSITDSATKYLKMELLEVWGFPDDLTEKRQAEFRQLEQDAIMSSRKIDKKDFLENGTNQFILEKAYAFKENMNIDLDFEKEQYKKNSQN